MELAFQQAQLRISQSNFFSLEGFNARIANTAVERLPLAFATTDLFYCNAYE